MTKLAEQAAVLANKGITVLCVQAPGVEAKTVDDWGRECNIPFPAVPMAADSKKARLAWGVKSLPWLILTNREHIVEANGFSLADLDERIERL